jgi:ribosomal protein L7Ae-like RNA K-turn-binding protein
MDSFASFFGLIKKAGKLDIGEEPVGSACRAKKSSLLITAHDAAPNTIRRATHFAETGQVPILTVPLNKEELGQILGRPPCAMVSINDVGFAAALVKKLAASNPNAYDAIHAQLEQRASKAMQRQKEKRAHEKNLFRGKKKS